MKNDSISKNFDFLDEKEVHQIVELIDALDRSSLDYLQLDIGELRLTIGKGAPISQSDATAESSPNLASRANAVESLPTPPRLTEARTPPSKANIPGSDIPDGNAIPIKATTMGRFYSRPDPKSPAFVDVGDKVNVDTPVGLIEVMKLFNSIEAGMEGTIVKVCVEDGQVVEFGQPLFFIRLDAGN